MPHYSNAKYSVSNLFLDWVFSARLIRFGSGAWWVPIIQLDCTCRSLASIWHGIHKLFALIELILCKVVIFTRSRSRGIFSVRGFWCILFLLIDVIQQASLFFIWLILIRFLCSRRFSHLRGRIFIISKVAVLFSFHRFVYTRLVGNIRFC